MKGNRKLLSIVIPNYNSGQLLSRCVDSILRETSDDYEVIIIDDGSTDNSIQLVPKNNTIKIILQKNQGVSAARNNGLDNAKGKYIMFVDADDTLLQGWGKILKDLRVYNEDLIVYNYYSNSKKSCIIQNNNQYKESDCSYFVEKALKNPTKYMVVWGKCFNANLIKDDDLRFDTTLRLAEDGKFLLSYLLKVKKIKEETIYLYHYQNNPNSVMHTFDQRKVDDYLLALKSTRAILPCKNKKIKHWFSFYVAMHINLMMVHEVFDIHNKNSFYKKVSNLQKILQNPLIRNAINDISLRECKSVKMLPILLLKLKLYVFAGILFTIRSKQNHG